MKEKTGNPELENGYFKISNELWEALVKIRIPGESRQVLDAIIRQTYGYKKKTDIISLKKFQELTEIKSKSSIIRGIKKLFDMKIIYQKVNNSYGFNKMYGEWKPVYQKVNRLLKGKYRLPKGKSDLPKGKLLATIPKYNYSKDNYSKDNTVEFDIFWKEYPKKVGKGDALKAFKKAKDKPEIKKLIEVVKKQKKSVNWNQNNGQYIPNPATWINGGRWDDELTYEAGGWRI